APVPGASVTFYGPAWAFDISDADGYYEVVLYYAGRYLVEASALEGEFEAVEDFEDDGFRWLNITLSAGGTEPGAFNYTVEGYVLDNETGLPIVGALVKVESDRDQNSTRTGGDGWFRLTVEARDWIDLIASASGYRRATLYLDAADVSVNVTLDPVNATLYWVKGYVLDSETEDPIVGATVIADTDLDYNFTLTDAEGWYYMEVMAEDRIGVMADASGYHRSVEDFDASDVEHDFLLERLAGNGTVMGYVSDEEGAPIPNATIAFQPFGEMFDPLATTLTDEDGFYNASVPGIPQMIMAMTTGYYPYIHGILVTEDETVWHNITLYAAGETNALIRGYIVNETGAPVNDAHVIAVPMLPGCMQQFENDTGADGGYSLAVPAGTFVLTATDDDARLVIVKVTVPESGTVWVNLTLVPSVNESWVEITLKDFEHGTGKMVSRSVNFGEGAAVRPFIDIIFGDADGNLSGEEVEAYAIVFEDHFMEGAEEEFERDAADNFLIDGVAFVQALDDITICGGEGSVFSNEPMEIRAWFSLEAKGTVNESTDHQLRINMSDGEVTRIVAHLPAGYFLDGYDAPDCIDISGVSTVVIETAEGCNGTWIALNVTSRGAPEAVTLEEATVDATSVHLLWTRYEGADFHKYEILRSLWSGSAGDHVAYVTDRNTREYVVTGLEQGKTYYFTVRVYDTDLRYADSNQLSVMIERTTSPGFDVFVHLTLSETRPKEGSTVTISATIRNEMEMDLELTVTFRVDGDVIHTTTVNVSANGTADVAHDWKAEKGEHSIEIRITSGDSYSFDT
ncbi:MAG TPA: hypothetical protein EYP43_04295, partial [Thermoplasmata archaeon]|nr:hypothetical protein [Thermoplasmata archaeon]